MSLLRSNFEAEGGPYRLRPSSLMYDAWVEAAGGVIKGHVIKGTSAAAKKEPSLSPLSPLSPVLSRQASADAQPRSPGAVQSVGGVRIQFKSPRTPAGASASPAAAAAGAERESGADSSAGSSSSDVPQDDLIVPLWLLKQSNEEQVKLGTRLATPHTSRSPLPLLQQSPCSNPSPCITWPQVTRLFQLLAKLPAAIHWYLEQVVFPTYTQHQHIKLSSSGQELGGSMLFGRRIGFSGTPSDLLPLDLGRCGYEKGSDGQMLHVLTSEQYMSCEFIPRDWTVDSLLERVATAEPRFHALIDTGALITGLGNKGVARRLLTLGLSRWCERHLKQMEALCLDRCVCP